jgi:hypothetical protein
MFLIAWNEFTFFRYDKYLTGCLLYQYGFRVYRVIPYLNLLDVSSNETSKLSIKIRVNHDRLSRKNRHCDLLQ